VRIFRPDRVFHLAALSRGDETNLRRVNLDGTVHLLNAVEALAPHARVLLVGSAAEYGTLGPSDLPVTELHPCRPVSAYARSKHDAVRAGLERAALGAHIVVARPFNIIGAGVPEELVVGALIGRMREALAGPGEAVVRVGNLDARRDFVDVQDVVDSYVTMIDGDSWGEVFNICSNKSWSIRDVAERLCRLAERPIRLEVDPALFRAQEVPAIFGSGAKALERFGFAPRVSLDESLAAAWRDGAVPCGF
jgi:nucleoside-diphosphate-sugar epimerase